MPRLVSFGLYQNLDKENPLKVTWESFNSLGKFTKIAIFIFVINLFTIPFIVNNRQDIRQRAAELISPPFPPTVGFGKSARILGGGSNAIFAPPILPANNMTFEAWVRTDDFTKITSSIWEARFIFNQQGYRTASTTLDIHGAALYDKKVGYMRADTWDSGKPNPSNAPHKEIRSGKILTTSVWHHIALTKDGVTMRLFFDGSDVANIDYDGPTKFENPHGLIIGASPKWNWELGSGEFLGYISQLEGDIDEVRVSNTARYVSNFSPPSAPFIPDSNTIALYHLDGNAQDSSGNGNNGQVIGNIQFVDSIVVPPSPSSTPTPTPTPAPLETPWQTNIPSGTLYTNQNWNYAMGYNFTPQVNGTITKLFGRFYGTKTVKLFNKTTGQLLATTSIASSLSGVSSWASSDITPVSVISGTTYTVVVYLAGTGGSMYTLGSSSLFFPQTYKNILISNSVVASTSSDPNASPTSSTSTFSSLMLGQVDIGFIPQTLEDSLAISQVGKWSFEEGSATTAKDTSGYGSDGVLSGAPLPTWQSSSNCGLGFGGCLELNGTSSYVNVPSFQSIANRNEYTIAAWFKTDKVTGEQFIMGETNSGVDAPVVNLGVSNSSVYYFHRDGAVPQVQVFMTFNINANEWHHLVGVRKASNSFEFFVDGVRRGTSSNNPGITTTNRFNIGKLIRPDPRPDYFDGLIDEVAVYTGVLSAEQIQQLYVNGTYPSPYTYPSPSGSYDTPSYGTPYSTP